MISRESLLPGWSFGICLVPAKFYQDRNAVLLIVTAKQPDRAGEGTLNWRKERCAICIHPIDAPNSGALVKQAKRNALKKIARLDSTVVYIPKPAKDELVGSRSLEFVPSLATNQTLCQFFVMDEPPPLKEVKILRPLRTCIEDFLLYIK